MADTADQTDTNEEQSTDQDAASEQSNDQAEGAAGEESAESTDDSTEDDAVELIGQKEFDKLQSDPAALRTALNRAATKKFQELSSEKKALEPYKGFISALESDPVAAVTAVARQLGIKIEGKTATEAQTGKVVESLGDRINGIIRTQLGPDYEDLADRMGAGITEALQTAIPELTRASQEKIDQIIQDSSLREAAAAIDTFAKKYPEWKKHEMAMTELSEKMPPGKGMSEAEYLENLYILVTRDRATGDGVKKVLAKMKEKASGGNGGDRAVADKNVAHRPAKPPSFREAYAAAKRGERLE